MTEFEEIYRYQYETRLKALAAKLAHNRDLSDRLINKLFHADIQLSGKTLDGIKAELHDSWTLAQELDSLHEVEIASDVNTLLALRKNIETEVSGDPVEPMGGMKPRDFY